jgi:hypothetical protein
MPTQDYNHLTTCFYVVEDGPDDLARPLHVTLDIAPTTAGCVSGLSPSTCAAYTKQHRRAITSRPTTMSYAMKFFVRSICQISVR